MMAVTCGTPMPATQLRAVRREIARLATPARRKVNLICLAGYMKMIPKRIIEKYRNRIINIHHSFLPAFAGAPAGRDAGGP
mgnify:CR=1 FL=1